MILTILFFLRNKNKMEFLPNDVKEGIATMLFGDKYFLKWKALQKEIKEEIRLYHLRYEFELRQYGGMMKQLVHLLWRKPVKVMVVGMVEFSSYAS